MPKEVGSTRFLIFLLIALSVSTQTGWAQSEFGNLIDSSTLFQTSFLSYGQPAFKWTLDGKLQATFNEGLTELTNGNIPRAAWYYHAVSLKRGYQPAKDLCDRYFH